MERQLCVTAQAQEKSSISSRRKFSSAFLLLALEQSFPKLSRKVCSQLDNAKRIPALLSYISCQEAGQHDYENVSLSVSHPSLWGREGADESLDADLPVFVGLYVCMYCAVPAGRPSRSHLLHGL